MFYFTRNHGRSVSGSVQINVFDYNVYARSCAAAPVRISTYNYRYARSVSTALLAFTLYSQWIKLSHRHITIIYNVDIHAVA